MFSPLTVDHSVPTLIHTLLSSSHLSELPALDDIHFVLVDKMNIVAKFLVTLYMCLSQYSLLIDSFHTPNIGKINRYKRLVSQSAPSLSVKVAAVGTGFESVHDILTTTTSTYTSQLIAVQADYTAEIEMAVGTEVYGPIFKAGLFLFASGLVSAFVAAFIVSKSDSWDELEVQYSIIDYDLLIFPHSLLHHFFRRSFKKERNLNLLQWSKILRKMLLVPMKKTTLI